MASEARRMSVRSAVRANVALLLAAVDEHRLRLAGLRPAERRLAQGGLAATAVGAAILAAQPLGLVLPGGEIGILRSDAPAITRGSLAISLLAVAAALAALAGVAALSASRWGKLMLVGVGLVGLLLVPSVLTIADVSPISVALGLAGLGAGVAVVAAGLVGAGRPTGWPKPGVWVPVLAGLAAAPPTAALLSVLAAALPGASPASENALATSVLNAATVVETPLVALAVWGVVEYGRGLAAASASVLGRQRLPGWLLPAVLGVKVGVLVALAMGFSMDAIGFNRSILAPATRESILSIAWAGGLTIAIGWWLLHGSRPRLDAGGLTRAAWLVFVPLMLGFLLPTLLFGLLLVLPNKLGLFATPDEITGLSTAITDFQVPAQALAPLLAAGLALAGGIALARWGAAHRTVAVFLLGFATWTLVPATTNALNVLAGTSLSDRGGGPLGFVHPVTLDLFVTALAVVLAIAWYGGWQRRVAPTTIAAIVLLSTVVAYGGVAFSGELGVLLFWLAFALPAVAQFVFDAGRLNEPRPDRGVRVLRASGLSALAMGTALPMVALGFVTGPGTATTADLARALFLVPFVAVLLASLLTDAAASEPATA